MLPGRDSAASFKRSRQTEVSPKIKIIAAALIIASLLLVCANHTSFLVVGPADEDDHHPTAQKHEAAIRGAERIHGVDIRTSFNKETEDGAFLHDNAASGQFTVVLLSYKSPKSLQNTLRSLCASKVHEHKQFSEFVVYFQVYDESHDVPVVAGVLGRNGACGEAGAAFRVIGSAENLPVASATFRAVRSVTTELVLYLECDRPVVDLQELTAEDRRVLVQRQLDAAIHSILQGGASVFRLQLYSSDLLRSLSKGDSHLPINTYGSTPYAHCRDVVGYHFHESVDIGEGLPGVATVKRQSESVGDDSPRLHAVQRGVCSNKALAKKQYGNVFYTAYCKHWTKLLRTATSPGGVPQQDMCDSFCFFQWATTLLLHLNRTADAAQDGTAEIGNLFAAHVHLSTVETSRSEHAAGVLLSNGTTAVLCTDSTWCNWSNQPSMYRRLWYLNNIARSCEDTSEGRSYCIGSPGRQSAVRQELFFVKRREHWAAKRHRVCMSTGLFIHNEVDNRE